MNLLLIFPGFIIAFVIVLYYERKIRRTEPRNKVHFYVARDKDYTLWLYMGKPFRCDDKFRASLSKGGSCLANICFRFYGLNEDDYADLKWEDEPVEVFLNLED